MRKLTFLLLLGVFLLRDCQSCRSTLNCGVCGNPNPHLKHPTFCVECQENYDLKSHEQSTLDLSGLVAYYSFDNGEAVGVGSPDGTIVGNVLVSTDRFGDSNGALLLRGGYVEIPDHPNFSFGYGGSNSHSVSFWYKVENTESVDVQTLVAHGGWNGPGFDLSISCEDRVLIYSFGSDYSEHACLRERDIHPWDEYYANYCDGAWHHVVATRDGPSGYSQIYHDGTIFETWTGPYCYTDALDKPLYIGTSPETDDENFDGYIDDLSIFERHLPKADVDILYRGECEFIGLGRGAKCTVPDPGSGEELVCRDGMKCLPSGSGDNYVCADCIQQSDCLPGHYCYDSATFGFTIDEYEEFSCVRKGLEGDRCYDGIPVEHQCLGLTECVENAENDVFECQKHSLTCLGDEHCYPNQVCVGEVCRDYRDHLESCSSTPEDGEICAEGLECCNGKCTTNCCAGLVECPKFHYCYRGSCTERERFVGEECDNDYDCEDENCVDGVCAEYVSIISVSVDSTCSFNRKCNGECVFPYKALVGICRCTLDEHCTRGEFCRHRMYYSWGDCVKKVDVFHSCEDDIECKSGFCAPYELVPYYGEEHCGVRLCMPGYTGYVPWYEQ